MKKSNRIVLFDFCETLCDFQTADSFVDFVRQDINNISPNLLEKLNLFVRKIRVLSYIDSHTRYKYSLNKRMKLYQLKGLSHELLDKLSLKYYEKRIRPHIIEKILDRMRNHQEMGDDVWIVSGGYGIYLRHFATEFGINNIISSNIAFDKNGVCKGRLDGIDCMGFNKITMLNNKLKKLDDYILIASYSDSVSDIPILSVAKYAYVVSKEHQKWVETYKFNEIIWE